MLAPQPGIMEDNMAGKVPPKGRKKIGVVTFVDPTIFARIERVSDERDSTGAVLTPSICTRCGLTVTTPDSSSPS